MIWYTCLVPTTPPQKPSTPLFASKKNLSASPVNKLSNAHPKKPVLGGEVTTKIHINKVVFLEAFSTVKGPSSAVVESAVVKTKDRFHDVIVKAGKTHDISPALIKAIIMAESGFNHKAVSRKGAVGLMQLMPRTAEELGFKNIHEPKNNINAGVKYLRRLMDQFGGDLSLALAAYNAGSKKVRMYKGIPPYKVTHRYINKVFKYYQAYKTHMAQMAKKA
jgi:soluble lytic murein transglycosylase-like protein